MAGRAERDALGRVGRVGPDVVVGADEPVDIDQLGRVGRQSGALADGHRSSSVPIVPHPDGAGWRYDRARSPIPCMDPAGRGVVQVERQAA